MLLVMLLPMLAVVVVAQCAETKIESTNDKVKLLPVSKVIKVRQSGRQLPYIFNGSGRTSATTTKQQQQQAISQSQLNVPIGTQCNSIAIGHTIKSAIVVRWTAILWLSLLINRLRHKKERLRKKGHWRTHSKPLTGRVWVTTFNGNPVSDLLPID